MAIRQCTRFLVLLLFAAGSVWGSNALADEVASGDLLNTGFPGFALPSTQDRLATYVGDYYGKHLLILTFFPAAFTPV